MKRLAAAFILLFILFYGSTAGTALGQYSGKETGNPKPELMLKLNSKSEYPGYLEYKDNSVLKPTEKSLINAGGIFLAPWIGIKFPIKAFRENSTSGLDLGVRLEFAHSKIYPIVFGVSYESQTYNGTDQFKSENVLGEFKTGITSFGGSVDIILSKYIKSDFTIPFVVLEAKFMKVTRTVTPTNANLSIPLDESLVGFTTGAGFTLFIFDIIGTYTFAQDYSTFGFKARFHFPLVKF